jgi:hypothetical protein
MKFNTKLFENILVEGKSESSGSIFDQIGEEEAKMAENQDLYDAFAKILKVLESPSRYAEIQSVAPSMDVNRGIIKIPGVCKHDVKADAQDLNRVEDEHTDWAYTDNIIDTYAKDLSNVIPKNLKLDYEIADDTMPKMDKKHFTIIISRKGKD